MKTTGEYLNAVKAKLDLPSDYATAKALDVTPSTVSKYRLMKSAPDDLVCARIAEILGLEPMEVIAAVHWERSTEPKARALWEGIWGKAVGAIALNLIVCAVGVSVAPSTKAAESGDNVISLSYVKLHLTLSQSHPEMTIQVFVLRDLFVALHGY